MTSAMVRSAGVGVVPRLPGDLARLRERYLSEHPDGLALTALLAHVPAALRHLLSLRLELDRADALPRRYRDLAAGGAPATPGDEVELLVVAYVGATRGGKRAEAAALVPRLKRFFTAPQVAELVLFALLARALDDFTQALT